MAFLTHLLCTILIHLATGQIASYNGLTINPLSPQFGNVFSNARSFTTPLASPGAALAPNIARNLAITGNRLPSFANRNSNTVVAASNPNLVTPNTGRNQASNLANLNVAAANLANDNLVNFQTPRNPANVNPTLSGNLVQNRLSNLNNPAQSNNPNIAINLASGNFASANRASFSNSYPNMGTPYSRSVHGPANRQYGMLVESDGLEMAGNVEVTGRLPFYGTVSFNGKLPTEGAGSVNYACSG